MKFGRKCPIVNQGRNTSVDVTTTEASIDTATITKLLFKYNSNKCSYRIVDTFNLFEPNNYFGYFSTANSTSFNADTISTTINEVTEDLINTNDATPK